PGFKILYLSSWHLNKNIHLLPHVASLLSRSQHEVVFVLSLSRENATIPSSFFADIKRLKVEAYFKFIGKVDAKHVHQVVNSSNSLILLSKLECFSSNVMEAFYFGKPLIISNEAWAVAACRDAAMYVDRDSAIDVSNKIIKLINDSDHYEQLVKLGKIRLQEFNTPESKVYQQVQFLE